MRKLAVFDNDSFAGVLTESIPGRGYTFQYSETYLAAGGNPISISLPLRREPFESENLFSFFSNIIPEGANRRMICRARHIDESDLFGLLCVMAGKDFIGSVDMKEWKEGA